MQTRASARLLLPGALALAAAGSIAAQEPPRFGEVIDVQLVNVEVWVTDGRGRPVRGLEGTDFEVFEDGRRVEITHFAEIHEGRELLFAGTAAAGEPEAAPPASPDATSHLVLYFDDLHLGSQNRKRLIQDLQDFLASGRVPPERVLILRQTHALITEAGLGSDLNTLDAALSRIGAAQPLGVQTAQEKRLAVEGLQQLWEDAQHQPTPAPCSWFLPRAVPEVELYARASQARIQITLDHLAAVATFLAGLPGLKTLLYASDALETTPGTDLLTYVEGVCPGGGRQVWALPPTEGLTEGFRRLTRHANSNRVTIYALQAFGLNTGFISAASQRSLDPLGASSLAASIRGHERDGLALLASQTGGRAVFNRNRFGAELADIGDEMRSYYSLAYEPRHGGDGDEHRIEVRIPGADLRVRHRRGYRDKNADERLEELLEGAIHLGLMSNPLAARLGAGTLQAGDDAGRFLLPLHVMLPAAQVAFLPADGGDMAHLKVRVVARDLRNRRVANEERLFRVARPPTGIETLDLVVPVQVDAGQLVLAVGLRDEATRETSYLSTSLAVGDAGGGRP